MNGNLSNSNASTERMVAAMQHNIDIDSGNSKRYNFVFGAVYDKKEADFVTELYSDSYKIDAELEKVKKSNIDRLGAINIITPDADFNNLFNYWLKHQLYLMADWARFYFKGYRDTLQDAAGMSIINPGRALKTNEVMDFVREHSEFRQWM